MRTLVKQALASRHVVGIAGAYEASAQAKCASVTVCSWFLSFRHRSHRKTTLCVTGRSRARGPGDGPKTKIGS